jgi:ferredoxin-type protein NapH
MKNLQKLGIAVFLVGVLIFVGSMFMGKFELTSEKYQAFIAEREFTQEILLTEFEENIVDIEFGSTFEMSSALVSAVEKSNAHYIALEQWDMKVHDKPNAFAYDVVKISGKGIIVENKGLFLFLTFGLCIIGSLTFILLNYKVLGPAGIKNNGIYQSSVTNRGWIGWIAFIGLFSFYVGLYFTPSYIVNQVYIVQPIKDWFGGESSHWFLYGVL